MHVPPASDVPPILKKSDSEETFQNFTFSWKNFLIFIRRYFWWPFFFFIHRPQNLNFPRFSLFQYISPCFAKIIISPLLWQISSLFYTNSLAFYVLYVYFDSPTFTMMHLCITQCTYWTPLARSMSGSSNWGRRSFLFMMKRRLSFLGFPGGKNLLAQETSPNYGQWPPYCKFICLLYRRSAALQERKRSLIVAQPKYSVAEGYSHPLLREIYWYFPIVVLWSYPSVQPITTTKRRSVFLSLFSGKVWSKVFALFVQSFIHYFLHSLNYFCWNLYNQSPTTASTREIVLEALVKKIICSLKEGDSRWITSG